MIEIKKVKEFPRGERLSSYATFEWMNIPNALARAEHLLKYSKTWLVSYQGRPFVMIGIYKLTLLGFGNRIWLLAFSEFTHNFRKLWKFLQRGIQKLLRVCGQLSIIVDLAFDRNINFARRLGFAPAGLPFYEDKRLYQHFEMRYSYGNA